jgi:hypothetical protein
MWSAAAERAVKKVKDKIAPGNRGKYKKLVFRVARGEQFDLNEAGDVLQGRTHEQFRRDVETAKQRIQAAKDVQQTPEETQELQALSAESNRLRTAAMQAAQAAQQAGEDYQAALRNQQYRSHEITGRTSGARGILQSTAEDVHAEIRSARGEVPQYEAQLQAYEACEKRLAQANQTLQTLADREAQLSGRTDVDAVTELAIVKANQAARKQEIKDLNKQLKGRDAAAAELAKIEADAQKIWDKIFDPEYMKFDFGERLSYSSGDAGNFPFYG